MFPERRRDMIHEHRSALGRGATAPRPRPSSAAVDAIVRHTPSTPGRFLERHVLPRLGFSNCVTGTFGQMLGAGRFDCRDGRGRR